MEFENNIEAHKYFKDKIEFYKNTIADECDNAYKAIRSLCVCIILLSVDYFTHYFQDDPLDPWVFNILMTLSVMFGIRGVWIAIRGSYKSYKLMGNYDNQS